MAWYDAIATHIRQNTSSTRDSLSLLIKASRIILVVVNHDVLMWFPLTKGRRDARGRWGELGYTPVISWKPQLRVAQLFQTAKNKLTFPILISFNLRIQIQTINLAILQNSNLRLYVSRCLSKPATSPPQPSQHQWKQQQLHPPNPLSWSSTPPSPTSARGVETVAQLNHS